PLEHLDVGGAVGRLADRGHYFFSSAGSDCTTGPLGSAFTVSLRTSCRPLPPRLDGSRTVSSSLRPFDVSRGSSALRPAVQRKPTTLSSACTLITRTPRPAPASSFTSLPSVTRACAFSGP